jgi:hypothetical protein
MKHVTFDSAKVCSAFIFAASCLPPLVAHSEDQLPAAAMSDERKPVVKLPPMKSNNVRPGQVVTIISDEGVEKASPGSKQQKPMPRAESREEFCKPELRH